MAVPPRLCSSSSAGSQSGLLCPRAPGRGLLYSRHALQGGLSRRRVAPRRWKSQLVCPRALLSLDHEEQLGRRSLHGPMRMFGEQWAMRCAPDGRDTADRSLSGTRACLEPAIGVDAKVERNEGLEAALKRLGNFGESSGSREARTSISLLTSAGQIRSDI